MGECFSQYKLVGQSEWPRIAPIPGLATVVTTNTAVTTITFRIRLEDMATSPCLCSYDGSTGVWSGSAIMRRLRLAAISINVKVRGGETTIWPTMEIVLRGPVLPKRGGARQALL